MKSLMQFQVLTDFEYTYEKSKDSLIASFEELSTKLFDYAKKSSNSSLRNLAEQYAATTFKGLLYIVLHICT